MTRRDPTRFMQIGFIALFFLCVLQVGYWITENVLYTRSVQAEIEQLANEQTVTPGALEQIAAASEGRANRYFWEGAFFLVVLIAGMAVLARTFRHDSELRRRQQNFLAAVSHEFKSPLASMQLAAETLIMRAPDPDARKLGQRILEDCERLLRMVDNLLDTTLIEEGRHELKTEQVNVKTLITATVDSFSERAARHAIKIEHDVPDSLTLAVDSQALDTILRNLIDNALKACIAGDGHSIAVSVNQSAGGTKLSVADDGLGFAPEDAELMFEKFHRLGDELRRKTPGTGLGLYIVKRLADLSGAKVSAASAGPGSGATVALEWPQRSAA